MGVCTGRICEFIQHMITVHDNKRKGKVILLPVGKLLSFQRDNGCLPPIVIKDGSDFPMTLTLSITFEALQDIKEDSFAFLLLLLLWLRLTAFLMATHLKMKHTRKIRNDPFACQGDKYQFPALHLLRIYLVYFNVFLFPIIYVVNEIYEIKTVKISEMRALLEIGVFLETISVELLLVLAHLLPNRLTSKISAIARR
uniref:Uncharacterized protein n=1 Tax=Glossina pallidipes TaxID=7398 RepID=A0A1A9ZTX3_GLOPL